MIWRIVHSAAALLTGAFLFSFTVDLIANGDVVLPARGDLRLSAAFTVSVLLLVGLIFASSVKAFFHDE